IKMRAVARPLAPRELDYELIFLCASLGGFASAVAWIVLKMPWPICLFHAVTGHPCLTCGATRSAIALFHGQFLSAFEWNPLVFVTYVTMSIFDVYAFTVLFRRAAMRVDESRPVNPTVRILPITRPDERRDELAHLEMQMREVSAAARANSCDLLPAPHFIAGIHENAFAVPVVRLHKLAFAILEVGVEHDDHVAPARAAFAREENTSVGHAVNRIAEIAVFAADPVQIVAEMFVFGKTLRVISERAVLAA